MTGILLSSTRSGCTNGGVFFFFFSLSHSFWCLEEKRKQIVDARLFAVGVDFS